jgi:cardiolipin synthase
VQPYLPVHFPTFTSKVNYRNHRKIIIIDGTVGYIGGMNIAQRYVSDKWRDTMLRLQGPIVYSLQRAFLIDWYFVDRTLITNRIYYPPFTLQHKSLTSHLSPLTSNNCLAQVVTSSPATLYPEIMQGFVRAITSARRYIYLETPYFLPNEPVLFALKTATMAGVDVRIICPHHSDAKFTEWASRSYLRELHEAGAQIFLYEPGFMHSKLMVIDDSLVTCGSTNADFRSFENNFEANVFIYSQGTALRLKKVFLDDQSLSTPLEKVTSWMRPKFLPRLWESLTRMISPLL